MKKLALYLILFTLQAHASNCYESNIQTPSPFMGNNDEIFKLDDGTIWKVKYAYEYMYEYYPKVIICPAENKLLIKGKTINVELISSISSNSNLINQDKFEDLIESKIEGNFEGWSGETIFKLDNGQIWQQTSYGYTYTYKYRPKVIIYRNGSSYEMQVEGVSSKIKVKKIN